MEVSFPKLEEQVLKKWNREKTFEKSVERRKNSRRFVFYEGPPTANGRPGLHHVASRAFKDVVLRYKTMRGFFVPRRAGWDTHGLPVELEVEKELGLKSKKDIERYGIARFNEECRKSVWRYQKEWEDLTARAGMWLDMENAYITYQTPYMETLWYIIAQWFRKGLLYKDYKVVPWCARCGTALSSHEMAQGYKTVKDLSVYVRFPVIAPNKEWENTSFLSWTTTPWTLPGNVALAINPKEDYICIPDPQEKYHWLVLGLENFRRLVKKGILSDVPRGEADVFKGREMIGLSYKSLFRFKQPPRRKKVWKVVPADFVSMEEGTGIVHTAVAYGADDFELGKKENLAMLHLVNEQGRFEKEAKPFAGKFVKDADPLIVEDLKKRGLLLKEEMYEHEYPFCWRCSTPLLYYARENWFVNMQKVKKQLLANNRKINWIPSHLKEGRMGEWLAEVKDWAFSRERYWGTPLPVWECQKCERREAIGSVKELAEKQLSRNTYVLMRHGHSERQLTNVMSSWPEKKPVALTEKGNREVQRAARKLKRHKIDLVVSSDLLRTKQTAQILSKELGAKVAYEKRLRELNVGKFNGKTVQDIKKAWARPGESELEHYLRRFTQPLAGGEDWVDAQKRTYGLVQDLEKKHKGKTILVVSHEIPLTLLEATLQGLSREEIIAWRKKHSLATGEFRKVSFARLPYNKEMEVDLHRPYIDEIALPCSKCKGHMKRVKDVVDVWYDSGAMPFAQNHWMGGKPKEFPADYIVEAIDQTRGWFYTLLAVSTLLGFGPSYKNAISLGHLLDEKGEKMSKSKGNVVSPWDMADKYGMDAARWYFFSVNHPWDPKLFAERDLQQTLRKFIMTLWNSLAFYETYKGEKENYKLPTTNYKLSHVLDTWIVSRLHTTAAAMTKSMDAYDITGATRLLERFVVEDLSLWYIRRARSRFQNPKSAKDLRAAAATLREVLSETALLSSPFIPFLAEYVFGSLQGNESVHLQDWPRARKEQQNTKLEQDMEKVRSIASKGLALRAKAGLRVRQPLASLKIQDTRYKIQGELLELLKDELNVREVIVDPKLKEDVVLDTRITPALKEEGLVRELARFMQDMRKDAGYKPGELARMRYAGDASLANLFQRHEAKLKKIGGLRELRQGARPKQVFDVEREVSLEGKKLWLGIRK